MQVYDEPYLKKVLPPELRDSQFILYSYYNYYIQSYAVRLSSFALVAGCQD